MVSKTSKVILSLTAGALPLTIFSGAFAADKNSNLEVNVKESLSVSVTTPATPTAGDADTFLRSKINVSVTSNNSAGFTASMTAKTADTFLSNQADASATLPTLVSPTTKGGFPSNYWGFSLDDTDAGSDASTYNAMVASTATPITLLSSTNATTGNKDLFFGAKSDVTLASGTYVGTVVINVVSGVIDNTNPITPTNPATNPATNNTPTYVATTGNTASGTTAYTYTRTNTTNNTTTQTTQISDGDNTDMYTGYTAPQGVYSSAMGRNVNTVAATASLLAAISTAAAASSVFFFIAAKRDKDDEEEPKQ